MKYYLKTFGCQANKSDSERIAGDYQARGFQATQLWTEADEIVINSCSVRQSAEDRVAGFLYNVNQYFGKSKSRPKIILTGCLVHYPTTTIHQIFPGIDEILSVGEVGFNSPAVRQDPNHAWVPISSGCNSFCTFCIVPYSRGRERSRPSADILAEVQTLAQSGYQEITLLGQNVNSYGLEKTGISYRKLLMTNQALSLADIPSNQSQYSPPHAVPPFVELIRQISQIDQIRKISFLTSNPWDFHQALIDEIATNQKIDRFIHLPVQSGSDRILRLMNRGYTRAHYLSLIKRIRAKVQDVQFGTDIIVGFPGETDIDFQATVDLAKEVDFTVGFVARYSPRPGTASSRLYHDDVPVAIKKKRWRLLDDLINKPNLSRRPDIK